MHELTIHFTKFSDKFIVTPNKFFPPPPRCQNSNKFRIHVPEQGKIFAPVIKILQQTFGTFGISTSSYSFVQIDSGKHKEITLLDPKK